MCADLSQALCKIAHRCCDVMKLGWIWGLEDIFISSCHQTYFFKIYFFQMSASKTRVFLLDCCASFLCMKRPGEEQVALTGPSTVQHRSLVYELSEDAPGPQATNDTMVYPSISGLKSSQTTGVPGGRAGEDETLLAKGPGSSAGNIELELAKLLDEVHSIAKHFRKQDVNMAMSNDWKFAALVIDRLCLVAFSVITILCTIGILMSAPRFIGAFSKNFN